jgi:hypothetical protein
MGEPTPSALGATDIGFMDGHAKWMMAGSIVAAWKAGKLEGLWAAGPTSMDPRCAGTLGVDVWPIIGPGAPAQGGRGRGDPSLMVKGGSPLFDGPHPNRIALHCAGTRKLRLKKAWDGRSSLRTGLSRPSRSE